MSQEKAAEDAAADPASAPQNEQKPAGDGAPAAGPQSVPDATSDEDQPDHSEAEPKDELTVLNEKLLAEAERATENRDLMLRTRAEMENLRKRQQRELENAHKYALDKIAQDLLPIRDSLEMGISAGSEEEANLEKILEGSELTLKMLTGALEKYNIVEVDPVGEKFDPEHHQAISMQEGTDSPANTVLTVIQKGYTLNERLLRPAMVIVAK